MKANNSTDHSISYLGLSIWLLASLFFLYEFFLRTLIGTIANQVMSSMHLSVREFALIGSAYYLAYAMMQLPVGILTDKLGFKKILVFAVLVCALSAFMFAHSHTFYQALISRFVMGFGSSFAFVCLLVIVSTWLPLRFFALFIGASQFIGTMGPLMAGGPLAYFLASSNGNWRLMLSEVGIFGLVLAFLVLMIVRQKPRSKKAQLIHLQPVKPTSNQLKLLLANKQLWFIALYSASTYVSMSVLGAIWGTSFLESCGLSQSTAATIISMAWLAYAIGCLSLGAISDMTKRRKTILSFCSILGLFCTSCFVFHQFESVVIYAILFFGLGFAASGQSVGFAAIVEHADISVKATALGMNNGFITLFATFLPPLVGILIEKASAGQLLNYQHFSYGLKLLPLLYSVSLLCAVFLIKETYCKPQREALVLQPEQAFN